MLAIVISLGVISIYLFYKYWISIYDRWEKNGIPSVPGKFPYGSSSEVNERFAGQVIQEMYNKMSEHPYFGIYIIRIPFLVIRDPEIIRLIMTKEFNHFRDRTFHKLPDHDKMNQHLFNLQGDKWRVLRVKLTPTFTSGKLKGMFPLFLSCSESLKNSLKAMVGSELDMKLYTTGYTTDTISSCAFGLEPNTIDNPNHDIRNLFKIFTNATLINKLLSKASKAFPFLSTLGRRIPIEIEEFLIKLVGETVEYREKNGIKRNDFLDLLIQMKNKGSIGEGMKEEITEPFEMNIDVMAAQTFVFLIAGMETSSSVQNFCLYELALHQDIQQRLRDEIDKVLEKHGEVSYQAMQEMEYLQMVISETMRKYPTLPSLARVCTTPFTMPSGDKIQRGDNILIPVFSIHRDPQYYPDPEKFDPERFSPENIESIKPYTYMPFGEGPRICIGNRFGLLQSKMGIMTVIRNFRVIPCEKTPPTIEFSNAIPALTLPKDKVFIKLVSRD